jgi:hypothetical protein
MPRPWSHLGGMVVPHRTKGSRAQAPGPRVQTDDGRGPSVWRSESAYSGMLSDTICTVDVALKGDANLGGDSILVMQSEVGKKLWSASNESVLDESGGNRIRISAPFSRGVSSQLPRRSSEEF